MWCTQCHVAFSWRTGNLVTNGALHNPHYYAYLRETRGEVPRAPGDLPCGGLPGAYDVDAVIRRAHVPIGVSLGLRELHRETRHAREYDVARLRRESGVQQNMDLRLQYLLRQIDLAEWRRKLQQREKKRERALAVLQVYDMFIAVSTDVFGALVRGDRGPQECYEELHRLRAFANANLATIAKRFNVRVKPL